MVRFLMIFMSSFKLNSFQMFLNESKYCFYFEKKKCHSFKFISLCLHSTFSLSDSFILRAYIVVILFYFSGYRIPVC